MVVSKISFSQIILYFFKKLHIFALGIFCQVLALPSDSWVRVDRQIYPYWDSLQDKSIFEAKSENTSWYLVEEIARAGLLSACYVFPHFPVNHTDPYCAEFFDDYQAASWFTVLQVMCLLSPVLSLLGSLHLALMAPVYSYRAVLHWLGTRLVVAGDWSKLDWKEVWEEGEMTFTMTSITWDEPCPAIISVRNGICASHIINIYNYRLVGCGAAYLFHVNVTKEFILYYDFTPYQLTKCWAFHVYLDGSLLHLIFGVLYLRQRWLC